MPHDTSLIATIAAGLSIALVCGLLAMLLRLSPLVGYLLAGVVIGPFTPGVVADAAIAQQLAEIGVIFLMFGVGLHFSMQDLWAVRKIAVPGAIGQIAVATALGIALTTHWGWPLSSGLVFGLALSVASTVVLLRAFREDNTLYSDNGRIAVGWLIVEDLVMVFVLVLLPVLAGAPSEPSALTALLKLPASNSLATSLLMAAVEVSVLTLLMLIAGRRLFPKLLQLVDKTGSRELFTLAVVVMAVGVAYGSAKLFGVSFALGAFFAGVVLNGSELSKRVAKKLSPLEDIFAVLFFVAMGMLFDPGILMREPMGVLAALAIVVIGKSVAAALIVLLMRRPLDTALTVSAGLAQIGEFSFILAGMAVTLKLLTPEGFNLIIAAAMISILINPLMFRAARALGQHLSPR